MEVESLKRFKKVHIEITNVCNLSCSFCPEVERGKARMNANLFENIISQVVPMADQVAFHLMGDPLVHPDLETFVKLTGRHLGRIFLVTNGLLIHKYTEILLDPTFRQVNFSLHSFFDNYPDRDPSEYFERIFHFCERALVERPDLYLNFRLWNLNSESPGGEPTPNEIIYQAIQQRFGVESIERPDPKFKKSVRLVGRLYMHFDSRFEWPSLKGPVLGTSGKCYGLRDHFGVLVDGTVVPCCLDKEGQIPLGRIPQDNITDILNSPRAQAMGLGFQQRKLVEPLCQRCSYIRRF